MERYRTRGKAPSPARKPVLREVGHSSRVRKPEQKLRRSNRISRKPLRDFPSPPSSDLKNPDSDYSDSESSNSDGSDLEEFDQRLGDSKDFDEGRELKKGPGHVNPCQTIASFGVNEESIVAPRTRRSARIKGGRDSAHASELDPRPDSHLHREDTPMGNTATIDRHSPKADSVMLSNIDGEIDGDRNQAVKYATRLSLRSASSSTERGPLRHLSGSTLINSSRTASPKFEQATRSAEEPSQSCAVAVFDSIKHIFDQPSSGKSKLASFCTDFASRFQKQTAEMISTDKEHEWAGKEIARRSNAAREVLVQATHELEKAQLAEEAFERSMVPLYRHIKDTAAKNHVLHGKALFELELIANAEERLLELQKGDSAIVGKDMIKAHVLEPFQNFMRKYEDLVKCVQ